MKLSLLPRFSQEQKKLISVCELTLGPSDRHLTSGEGVTKIMLVWKEVRVESGTIFLSL